MRSWRPTAVGVDVQGRSIFLALAERRGRELVVRRLVEVALPDAVTDDHQRMVAAVVARAVRDEALAADRLVMGLSAAGIIVRRLELPVTGARKVAQALAGAIEPLIPYTAEDIFADSVLIRTVNGGSDVLAFAARREDVAPLVHALEQAGVHPEIATPDLVAVLAACPAADADREAVVYLRGNRGFVAVREDFRFVEFRPLSGTHDSLGLRRDVRRSLMALMDEGAPLARVLMAGDALALADVVTELELIAEPADLQLPATVPEAVAAGVGDPRPWEVAICLAAQGLKASPHAVNFCQAELATDQVAAWLGPLRRTAILAGVTLLIYTGSLFTQRVALRSQRDRLRRGIQNEFAASLPGITTLAAAGRQVTDTREAHQDLGLFVRPGPQVIEVLAACDVAMRGVPKVRIESLAISGDVLRLTGEVADFRAVTTLEAALAASPMLLDVQTTRAGEGRNPGSTAFRLNARVNARGTLDNVPLAVLDVGSAVSSAGADAVVPAMGAAGPGRPPPADDRQTAPAPVALEVFEAPQTAAVAGAVSGEQTSFAPGTQPVTTREKLNELFAGDGAAAEAGAAIPWPATPPAGGADGS